MSIVFSLGIGVVLFLAVSWAAASADEPEETVSETRLVRLEPGDNFVGWIDDSMPIGDLFETIPQIEAIYFWDAADRHWRIAAPKMPRSLWTLFSLDPGMGVLVRIGGDQVVQWRQPITPAQGLVELHEGTNWVSWAGPDDWDIEQVTKGIGRALVRLGSQGEVYDVAVPSSAATVKPVSRGDSLAVTVSRPVNWLQPTYVMPELIFPGIVDPRIRRDVERDLTDILTYSAKKLGVQADPWDLTVIVATSGRAMYDELTLRGHDWDWASFESLWTRGVAWGGSSEIIMSTANRWSSHEGQYSYGRYLLLHEYFHALQFQSQIVAGILPIWLTEGSAKWIETDLMIDDGWTIPPSQRIDDIRRRAPFGPSLESVELANGYWHYSFGQVAADLLVQRIGEEALLDYYRAHAPSRTGPGGMWQSHSAWQDFFERTFGVSVEDFYAEFEATIAKDRGRSVRRPQPSEVRLRGTVVDSAGSPRAGIWVTAVEIRDGATTSLGFRRGKTDEDGEFILYVDKHAAHRISIQLAEHDQCHYRWDADLIEVQATDPKPLVITVEADKCRWRISGTLTGPDSEPLVGVEVRSHGNGYSTTGRTEIDGSFELVASSPGTHQLSVELGGCRLYWAPEGPTTEWGKAGGIEVLDQDVTDVGFVVSSNPCISISGYLFDADGNSIEGAQVNARADGDSVGGRTDADGRFRIAVSEPGRYRLYVWLDGCIVHHRAGGAVALRGNHTPVEVTDLDVGGIVFQVSPGMCEVRISGTLLNADGTPPSHTWVATSSSVGYAGDWTDANGLFSFAVPANGEYRLRVDVENCRIYYDGESQTSDRIAGSVFTVANADINGIEFRLPEDPAAFCD